MPSADLFPPSLWSPPSCCAAPPSTSCPLVMGSNTELCPLTLAEAHDLHVFLCCSTCHVAVKALWLDWSAAVHVDEVEARRVAPVFVRLTRLLVDRWAAEQKYSVTKGLRYLFCVFLLSPFVQLNKKNKKTTKTQRCKYSLVPLDKGILLKRGKHWSSAYWLESLFVLFAAEQSLRLAADGTILRSVKCIQFIQESIKL